MSAYPNNLITIFIFKFLTFCISFLFSFCRSHIGDHAYDHFLGKCPPPPLHRLLFISQLGWPSTVQSIWQCSDVWGVNAGSMGRSKEAMHCGRSLLLFYVEEAPMEYEDFRYLKDWMSIIKCWVSVDLRTTTERSSPWRAANNALFAARFMTRKYILTSLKTSTKRGKEGGKRRARDSVSSRQLILNSIKKFGVRVSNGLNMYFIGHHWHPITK